MVALDALERGRLPPRSSGDLDVLVNIRVLTDGTERISRVLCELGLELGGANLIATQISLTWAIASMVAGPASMCWRPTEQASGHG